MDQGPNSSYVAEALTGPIGAHDRDLPHNSAETEWWHVNGHLHVDGSELSSPPFSFCASFFKLQHDSTRKTPACVFSWSIVDMREGGPLLDPGTYYSDTVLDLQSKASLESAIMGGSYELDKFLLDPLKDILKKGNIPGPDRYIRTSAKISQEAPLSLGFGSEILFTHDDATDTYRLSCENLEKNMMLDLELAPQHEAVQQKIKGDHVKITIPKLAISGKMSVLSLEKEPNKKGVKQTFEVKGSGYYEHGFGGKPGDMLDHEFYHKYFSHAFSLQLSNNTQVSALHFVDPRKPELAENSAIVFYDSNSHKECPDLEVKDISDATKWMSTRTSLSYSLKWQLTIPSAKVDLRVEPAMESQEIISFTRNPATWEGRVHVTGTVDGEPVTGYGFLQMHTATGSPTFHDCFKNFIDEATHQMEECLPRNPTLEQMHTILNVPMHMIQTLDVEVIKNAIINPLRDIIDRGGKCWRSYCVLLCIDSVGGDSNPYRKLMVLPEIIQAGTLIQDDIQDRSEIRRGGPCCHKVYGDAVAISAFSSAYFIAVNQLQTTNLIPPQFKLEVFSSYLSTMRAGSIGQAIDVQGFEDLIPEAIEKGDNTGLLARMLPCYKLKTGAAFYFCAKLGAYLGGGTEAQTNCLTKYFEALAMCFQLVDDVLNLRGFAKPHKTRGEDIIEGKITSPIAMAMSSKRVPSKEARQSIFDRLKSKPNPIVFSKKMEEIQSKIDTLVEKNDCQDELKKLREEYETNKKMYQQQHDVLYGLIDELEKCGAIEEANQMAVRVMEDTWQEVDATLSDTRYKLLLKAFGSFMLSGKYN